MITDRYWSKSLVRRADVVTTESRKFVEFYDNDVLINILDYSEHDITFAQAAAENYCEGVLHVANNCY